MYPALDQVLAFAENPEYSFCPLSLAVCSDMLTPVSLMRVLQSEHKACFLLESATQDMHWGRWSFLGYDPECEVTVLDGAVFLRRSGEEHSRKIENAAPFEYLRGILEKHKSPSVENMPPFTGGLVGFFAYDCIKYAEPCLDLRTEENADVNDIDLMLFKDVFVFDHYKNTLHLITNLSLKGDIAENYRKAEEHLLQLKRIVDRKADFSPEPLKLKSPMTHRFSEEKFVRMVETAKEHIYRGDIFQAVLSNPITAEAEGSLFDTYRVLRTLNPSPYMFYFSGDNLEIAGASPETLVSLKQGKISTFPLAGTRRRGKTEQEDRELEQELLHDQKELAEHNMLVDLGRNDLGKIAKLGTVRVETYQQTVRFSHVMHIGSTVTAELAQDKDALDAVMAVLPAGTLSGAPKIRACQIIHELEGHKRGIYGGAVGYLDFAGNMDTCIAIRLAYKKGNMLCVQSGAGIVFDSDPKSEFLECRNKAQAVISALEKAEGGIL